MSTLPPKEPTDSKSADRTDPTEWSIERSREVYLTRGWGSPYFDIDKKGHVVVRPDPRRETTIDLCELTHELWGKGLDLPLLIRFSDILDDRIRQLNQCFQRAIDEYHYEGSYRGVYPVKVNQQRHIVEEVVEYGKPWNYGLEAGSKPELLIALACMRDPDGLIICNGYKDAKYIETALLAQRLDNNVVIVLERIEELDLVFAASEKLGLSPTLGVRAKLTSRGVGRWADSTGDKAKFGLTAAEVVHVIDRLQEKGKLHWLQLLHFHIGSQISSILALKNAMREAAQYYVELAKMGCTLKYLDVGGGLAVDYDGSRSDFHASKNYTTQEYAYDIVAIVQEACGHKGIPSPTIVTESGRAVAAHQSVLVFQVLGVSEVTYSSEPQQPAADAHPVIRTLYETWRGIQPKNLQEAWHDASQAKDEARSLFQFGYLSLRERATAESLFWSCCEKIQQHVRKMKTVPEELQDLEQLFASVYYANFSIFQSIPDSWAIDQLFPVMPIHRLNEAPTARARLGDLTCDSDGIMDRFIDTQDVKRVLELHPFKPNEPYLMAVFLNGAYQEILGDMHNLFGDTNAVHVRLDDEGYHVSHVVKGDSITDVLRYTQYDPKDMIEHVRQQAERAYRAGRITIPQMRLLMRHYEESLSSYTYLTDET
jgi:arginine decarboxylase